MSDNLYQILRRGFPTDPAAPCLETLSGSITSYSDLDAGCARMAGALDALGVVPGDRVMVQVDKSPQAVMLYLACLRVGAVYVPLNTAYTAAELEYFLSDSEPQVVICRDDVLEAVEPRAEQCGVAHVLTLDAMGAGTLMDRARAAVPRDQIMNSDGEDLAAILYTSGTTGRSKGAMLTHANLSSNAIALHRIWGFVPGDVLIHALPIFHVHGLFVALHTALLNGSRIYFLPHFNADQIIHLLPRASVLMGVPTFYTRLLSHPELTQATCRAMRLFVSGSAPLLKATFDEFERRTGQRILERYGMTEAGMITSNPLDGERLPETVGYPLPGVEVRVADDKGKALGAGQVGVLEIKGPNVFKGYWRAPEKTQAEFREDGYFVTGDLVRMAEDGRIAIVGREKDLIISGGYNVYPKEIEACIDNLAGVAESAVVGVPHPDFGEGVIGVIVSRPEAALSEQGIQQALAESLAKFKIPKRVFIVDELPRNAMGKVQKNVLRQRYAKIFQT